MSFGFVGHRREPPAADANPDKLQKALDLGAHAVFNSAEETAVGQVKELTGGGADIGLECAGTVPALEFTYRATRRGGKTVSVGLPHPDKQMAFSPVQLTGEERILQGSYLGGCVPSRDVPNYISLYRSGRLPVDQLLTHTLTLEQINEGFERLAGGEAIRQVIVFD